MLIKLWIFLGTVTIESVLAESNARTDPGTYYVNRGQHGTQSRFHGLRSDVNEYGYKHSYGEYPRKKYGFTFKSTQPLKQSKPALQKTSHVPLHPHRLVGVHQAHTPSPVTPTPPPRTAVTSVPHVAFGLSPTPTPHTPVAVTPAPRTPVAVTPTPRAPFPVTPTPHAPLGVTPTASPHFAFGVTPSTIHAIRPELGVTPHTPVLPQQLGATLTPAPFIAQPSPVPFGVTPVPQVQVTGASFFQREPQPEVAEHALEELFPVGVEEPLPPPRQGGVRFPFQPIFTEPQELQPEPPFPNTPGNFQTFFDDPKFSAGQPTLEAFLQQAPPQDPFAPVPSSTFQRPGFPDQAARQPDFLGEPQPGFIGTPGLAGGVRPVPQAFPAVIELEEPEDAIAPVAIDVEDPAPIEQAINFEPERLRPQFVILEAVPTQDPILAPAPAIPTFTPLQDFTPLAPLPSPSLFDIQELQADDEIPVQDSAPVAPVLQAAPVLQSFPAVPV